MIDLRCYMDIDFQGLHVDINDGKYILFTDLQRDTFYDDVEEEYISSLKIETIVFNTTVKVTIKYQNPAIPDMVTTQTMSDINQLLQIQFNDIFKGYGRIITNTTYTYLLQDIDKMTDLTKNAIFLYRNSSSRNTVDKTLVFVNCMDVKYTRPITHKRMMLDIKHTLNDESFNYVYLTVLNRFYYVEDATLTNEFYTLSLSEDVLMSFKDLIRSQTAYVERNQYNIDSDKVDDLISYDYDKSVTTSQLTDLLTLNSELPSTIDNLIQNMFVVIAIGE